MSLDLNPQLLEALQVQGVGSGALPSTQELLSQLETTNPTAGLIAKYLIARQESERESRLADEAETERQEAEEQQFSIEQSERLARIIQRLDQVKELRSELEQLRERNDVLATALGACYLCWGEDPTCPVCRGNGYPGFAMPDTQLFAKWVAPALYHLKAQKEVKGKFPMISRTTDSLKLERQKGEKNG